MSTQSRRNFILKAGAGAVAISSLSGFKTKPSVTKSAEQKFKLGVAGYTFVKFDLDKSLEMMNRIGATLLSIKNFHLPYDCTDDQIKDFKKKLADHNITGYCVGPIYMKSEKEVDNAFDYTKRIGVDLMIGVPNYDLLPYTEKKVKEYNIRLAIHNHGPDSLGYPTASDIINRVGKMDKRMGMCLDIGHNKRGGEDPIMAIQKFNDRIFDMHIKDINEASKAGHGVEVGRGILDLPKFFTELKKTKYSGVCSLEYEKDQSDPLVGLAESYGYLNGVLDSIG